MQHYFKQSLIISLSLLLLACASTPKTEQEQYDELRDSLSYKTLRQLSDKTINPSLSLYNGTLKNDDTPEVHPELVHALSAVIFAIGQKTTWAVVEADLAVESAKDNEGLYVAYSALSIALYSNGWKGLGTQYADKATALEKGVELDKKYESSRLTAKVIVGIFAINQGNADQAEVMFAELGEKTGQPWLPLAANAAAIAVDGPGLQTVPRIKQLASRTATMAEKEKLLEIEAISANQQTTDHEKKNQTNKLVKDWSMKALDKASKDATQSAIDATLNMVNSLLKLVSFG